MAGTKVNFCIQPPEGAREVALGGKWRCSGRAVEQLPLMSALQNHIDKASRSYLIKRHTRHQQRQGQDPQNILDSVPWDRRLWKDKEQWSFTTFKAKLWAQALPTRELRNRLQADPVASLCNLCEGSYQQTQWHILQRCSHPQLTEMRKSGAQEIRKCMLEMKGQLHLDQAVVEDWWSSITTEVCPVTMAGIRAYGQFPATWLDNWWTASKGTAPQHWHTGRRVLAKIAS